VYAILEDSGRQYRVNPGDRIYVDLRELAEGQNTIEFNRVLMLGDGEQARIGRPLVEGAKVIGRIEREVKGPKVVSFKMRERKNYRRKVGHRQRYLQVTINEILA
jgi:large subunit ribosomal protein L21